MGSHLTGVIGANAVTREDAVLSVHAGFNGIELSALWPAFGERWRIAGACRRSFQPLFLCRASERCRMNTEFDAVIIGGGPAGSSAAIMLARAGWTVALIEKQNFPRRKVCGECIAASNLPLLQALGIGPAFEAGGRAGIAQVALMHGERTSGG